jgi:hypothetical protein
MSRNGAGVYTLAAGNPVVTGTTISSTWANNTLSDIATALTQSLAKDGQTTPTANIPMGSFKLTGLGAPTVAGDALAYGSPMGAISGTTGTFTGNVQMASANGSCLAGLRNRVINGNFYNDQRNAGASQTITAAAALAYTVDRFYAYCTGANVTGQRVAGTAPNAYLYRFTGAASVTKIGFAQRIENLNCQDLAGQTATLSVDLSNSLLTTVTWTAWYANTANTFGTLASPTRTSIATGTFTVNSTLTNYSTNITIPAAATTGIEIELSVGAQISGTWNIGDIQLEIGSVVTPFEQRPIGMELALCQRYYERIGFNSERAFFAAGGSNTTTDALGVLCFLVKKRISPTVFLPTDANSFFISSTGIALGSSASGASAANITETSLLLTVVGSAATLTAGRFALLSIRQDTNISYFIGISAEL